MTHALSQARRIPPGAPVQFINWIGSPSREQEIALPLALPDDRRLRTRIELAPE